MTKTNNRLITSWDILQYTLAAPGPITLVPLPEEENTRLKAQWGGVTLFEGSREEIDKWARSLKWSDSLAGEDILHAKEAFEEGLYPDKKEKGVILVVGVHQWWKPSWDNKQYGYTWLARDGKSLFYYCADKSIKRYGPRT